MKSLKFNSFINLTKTVLGIIFPFITFPYASRVLGTQGLGKVSYAQSVIYWFELFAALGISTYLTREGARVRDDKPALDKLCTELFIFNIVSTVISYMAMAGIITLPVFAPYRSLLVLCGTTLMFNLIGMDWIFNIFEDYLYITVRTLVFQVISLLALFIFVRTKDDYLIYAGLTVFSSVGSNIYNFFYARRYVHLFPGGGYDLKRHIKPVLIIFGMSVASAVYLNMDMTMLGYMKGDHEEGLYSAAVKINKIVCRLITSACAVLIPRLSYYFEKGMHDEFHSVVRKAVNYLLGLTIPAAVGMFILSRDIILVFSGESFADALSAMQILCPNIILAVFNGFLSQQIFIPMGREKRVLAATITGAFVNLTMNFVLIGLYGAGGAATATVCAEGAVCLVCMLSMRSFYVDKKLFSEIWKYALASVFMALCCSFLKLAGMSAPVELFLVALSGTCIYVLVLLITKSTILVEVLGMVKGRILRLRNR